MEHDPRQGRAGLILALSVFVLLWRVAAAVSPYREGALATMNEDPLGVRWGLGIMGLVFVACGLIAHACDRRRATMIFALYACAGGLHWGGPIDLADSTLEAALFLLYFVVSDLLGRALLLHFTLLFTGTSRLIVGRRWLVLYLPAAAGCALTLGILGLPMESAASTALRQGFWILVMLMNVYDLGVLAALIVRAVRPVEGHPARRDLLLVLSAFAIVALVSLLPSIGLTPSAGGDLLNFVYVVIPIAFTLVIVKRRGLRRGRS